MNLMERRTRKLNENSLNSLLHRLKKWNKMIWLCRNGEIITSGVFTVNYDQSSHIG